MHDPLDLSFRAKNCAIKDQFELIISNIEKKLKNCEEVNINFAVSLEELMQKSIQDQFAGRKISIEETPKPEEEKNIPICTFESIWLSSKSDANGVQDQVWPDLDTQKKWLEGDQKLL